MYGSKDLNIRIFLTLKMAPGRRRDRSSVNPCLKYFIFLFNFVFLVSRPREIMVFVLTVRVFCSVRKTLVFSEFNKLLCCNDRHCDCESSSTLYSQNWGRRSNPWLVPAANLHVSYQCYFISLALKIGSLIMFTIRKDILMFIQT